MCTLFNIFDVVDKSLILESTEEHLIWDEFKVVMFIAAKAQGLLEGKSTEEFIENEYQDETFE
jgi:hypothetical protein